MPALRGELGRDRRQEPRVGQQSKPDGRDGRREDAAQFLRDPLARQEPDPVGPCLDPGQGGGLHPEAKGRGEPDHAKHPQGVLLESVAWVADRSQDAGRDVGLPAVRVHEVRGATGERATGRCAPGDGIGGDVAAREIQLDRVGELDPMRTSEVGVVVIGTQGRDRDVAGRRVMGRDDDRPERVLVQGMGEERKGLLGQRGRRQIPVVGHATQQRVAHGATHHVRRMLGAPQGGQQPEDRCRDRGRDGGRSVGPRPVGRQFFPMKRYIRHVSLRSSAR